MKRLVLQRSDSGGELAVWEMPVEGAEYIASCDPSLGREWSEDGDHTSVGIWRRHEGRVIEQVAHWYGRWTIHNAGIMLAQLARAYNNATVNIERNISDAARFAMTEIQGFDPAYFFIPRDNRNIKEGELKVYFTTKSPMNEHYLWNTLQDYMDRKAVLIRDRGTRSEMMSLSRKRNGAVDSNGKDRSVMVVMAVVADQEMPAFHPRVDEEKKKDVRLPGVFRLPEKSKKSGLGARNIWGAA